VYYLTVSEFRQKGAQQGDKFRINGKVVKGSIERMPTGQDVAFVMTDGGAELPVRYHGIIPDTFVDGADVVVEGSLAGDGTFVANNMLAKCPSKYEAAAEAQGTQPAYGTKSY
jgi:cytochrome c-type biogenesis protein CcmE